MLRFFIYMEEGSVGKMVKTYIINIKQLEDDAVFEKAAESVSVYRKEKIALLKHRGDKNRSLGAALALNAALSEYGLCEQKMEYALERHGKPFFPDHPNLHFSLSHSGDYAMCSLGEFRSGNDIECVRGMSESRARHLAGRFFAEEENAWIDRTGNYQEWEERLFRIWTMKESFLKVTGLGMSLSLKDFAIIVEDDESIRLRHAVNERTYYMKEYVLPEVYQEKDGYRLSVCSESPDFVPTVEVVAL